MSADNFGARHPRVAYALVLPFPALFVVLWFGAGDGLAWLILAVGVLLTASLFNSPLSWLVGGPLMFLATYLAPFPEAIPAEGQAVAAVAVLMASWWITETIPLGATALVPIVLFPVLGIQSTTDLLPSYAHWFVYLVLGGFMIGAAMQRWGLHKRFALWIISVIGSTPSRTILGFMIASAFISMWVTNTATTVMMLPVAAAVLEHIRKNVGDEAVAEVGPALMLSIAYASSIGGTGTVIGTGPNGIFVTQASKLFGQQIDFVTWLSIGIPCVVILIPITWLYLTRIAFKMPPPSAAAADVIAKERRALGSMSRGEKAVAVVFSLCAILWLTRRNVVIGSITIPGYESIMPRTAEGKSMVSDSTVAILGALLLFMIPVNLSKREFVLDIKTAMNVPWDVLLILGGGIALAGGFASSGLSSWVADSAVVLKGLHPAIIVLVLTVVITFLTELTSNTATSTICLPVLAYAAVGLGQHPYLLMLPCCLAVSMAFMLPVATPPNAIAFASGYVRAKDMARAGFGLNLIAATTITVVTLLLITRLMGIELGVVPEWASTLNAGD